MQTACVVLKSLCPITLGVSIHVPGGECENGVTQDRVRQRPPWDVDFKMAFNVSNVDLSRCLVSSVVEAITKRTQRAKFSLKFLSNSASRSVNGNGCAAIACIGFCVLPADPSETGDSYTTRELLPVGDVKFAISSPKWQLTGRPGMPRGYYHRGMELFVAER